MSHTSFPLADLARLIGTARAPVVIDVRSDDDFAADPRLIPGSIRRDSHAISDWAQRASSWQKHGCHLQERARTQSSHRCVAA